MVSVTKCLFKEEEKVERAMSDAYSRIFALLECPFLALSATIRNPEDTREWLQSVRNFSPLPEAVVCLFILVQLKHTLNMIVRTEMYTCSLKTTLHSGDGWTCRRMCTLHQLLATRASQ